jgi:hypothetical protein
MHPVSMAAHAARAFFRAAAQLILLFALAAPLASLLPTDAQAQLPPCPPICGGGGGGGGGGAPLTLDYQGSAASTYTGQLGTAVNLPANAAGGTAPYTFSSGALPSGLSLDPATGTISGTPTTADPGGIALGAVTITVDDGDLLAPQQATATITFDIAKGTPNVAAVASAATVTQGTNWTLDVTVTGAGVNPAGTVTFLDAGNNVLGAQALNGAGQASFSSTSLPLGPNTITAKYSGDGNYDSLSVPVTVTVNAAPAPSPAPAPALATPTVLLESSANPSAPGAAVTFKATVTGTGGTPSGTVTFTVGSATQTETLNSSGVATVDAFSLPVGTTTSVTAAYSGDAKFAPGSASLTQSVGAAATGGSGTVTFVVVNETTATAGVTLYSAVAALNNRLVMRNAPVTAQVAAGTHTVTVSPTGAGTGSGSDMSGPVLNDISCTGGGVGDRAARSVTLTVTAGVTITCTATLSNVATKTSDLQSAQSTAVSSVVADQTTSMVGDQIGIRLVGGGGAVTPSAYVGGMLAMLPAAATGGPVMAAGSLSALDKLVGRNGKQRRLDIWFQARWQGVRAGGLTGNVVMGAVGMDYLITPKALIGGFVTVDFGNVREVAGPGNVSGTGWIAGVYAGGRLSKNLILDGLAGGGMSWNRISPFGTYTDGYTSTRLLASTSLTGNWDRGSWTFAPRLQVSYNSETSAAYVDSLGVTIAPNMVSTFEAAAGPGFSYRFVTDGGMTIEPGLTLEAVARLRSSTGAASSTAIHGRLTPKLALRFAGGASLNLSTNVQLGANFLSYGATADVRIPLR